MNSAFSFIFLYNPSSYKTLQEYLSEVKLNDLSLRKLIPGKDRREYRYE